MMLTEKQVEHLRGLECYETDTLEDGVSFWDDVPSVFDFTKILPDITHDMIQFKYEPTRFGVWVALHSEGSENVRCLLQYYAENSGREFVEFYDIPENQQQELKAWGAKMNLDIINALMRVGSHHVSVLNEGEEMLITRIGDGNVLISKEFTR